MNKNEDGRIDISKNTAFAEAAHWDGMKVDLKLDEKRIYPKGKDARIIGSDADMHLDLHMEIGEASDEIAIDHEGFLEIVKGGVRVAIEMIKVQPGIIRDLLHFAFDAIKLAVECKMASLNVRRLEAEERLLRTKEEFVKNSETCKAKAK